MIMRIDFTEGCVNSDGVIVEGTERPICVLYNDDIISGVEVKDLIRNGEYEWDNRIVVTTTARADNLKGKGSPNEKWISASKTQGVNIGMKRSLCGARIKYSELFNGSHIFCRKCGAKMNEE